MWKILLVCKIFFYYMHFCYTQTEPLAVSHTASDSV